MELMGLSLCNFMYVFHELLYDTAIWYGIGLFCNVRTPSTLHLIKWSFLSWDTNRWSETSTIYGEDHGLCSENHYEALLSN